MKHAGDIRVEFGGGQFFDVLDRSVKLGACADIPLYEVFAFYALVKTNETNYPYRMIIVPNEDYFKDWVNTQKEGSVEVIFSYGKTNS